MPLGLQRIHDAQLVHRSHPGVDRCGAHGLGHCRLEPAWPAGGSRRYGEPALVRLRFVRAARRLGFSLDEVAELLALDDGQQCGAARAQAERKLADVRAG
jgi:MerR family mercuric resistance operon transcriptional regulator